MKKILIDTDPGIDDALALLFALRCPHLDVVAATSIFGNCNVDRATRNLGRLLEFADHTPPIGLGARLPLFGPSHAYATFVHGDDALGDVGRAGDVMPAVAGNAAQLIVETVRAHPGEVTIVALGPLTNLALALAIDPDIVDLVADVVVMGGAVAVPGNAGAVAEANIIHDAYAADRVFAGSWPTTLITLDVTNEVIMSAEYLDDLGRTGGDEGRYLRDVTRFYQDFHRRNGVTGMRAHDPTAMIWTILPDAFELAEAPATVVTGGIAHGQTIIDRRGQRSRPVDWNDRTPLRHTVGVDADAVLEVFRSALVD